MIMEAKLRELIGCTYEAITAEGDYQRLSRKDLKMLSTSGF